MFARVSTIQGKPGQIEEVIHFFEKSAPKGLEDMKGGYVLVNRKTGKLTTITLWETEKALQASASAAEKILGQAALVAAGAPPTVETYEVALEL